MGSRITSISQIILVAVFLIALFMEFRRRKPAPEA
jgi:uncharacterized membrane-anchored protein